MDREEIKKLIKEEVSEQFQKEYPYGGGGLPDLPKPPSGPFPGKLPPMPPEGISVGPFPDPTGREKGGYPFKFAAPLPSTLLRPLQQPIYDAEWYPTQGTASLEFMRRPVDKRFKYKDVEKGSEDTNLLRPGELANPLEFSLFGFSIHLQGIDPEVRAGVLQDALFRFVYVGNRIYLEVPLFMIPERRAKPDVKIVTHVLPEGGKTFADMTVEEREEEVRASHESYRKGIDDFLKSEEGNYIHKFLVGRSALRIRPTESFGIHMQWPKGAVSINTSFKIYTTMHGLMWTPL